MRTEARTPVTLTKIPPSRYIAFAAVLAVGLWWDLYSKWWTFSTLGYENGTDGSWWVSVWGPNVFCLMTHFNHGALFGMGQGLSWLFALLSVFAAGAVLYWLFLSGGARSWWLTIALSLLMAGALGNLYDRLGLHGLRNHFTGEIEYAVRDFLYFELIDWPIFNFADTYLVTGAIMLLIQSFMPETAGLPEGQATAETPSGASPPISNATPMAS